MAPRTFESLTTPKRSTSWTTPKAHETGCACPVCGGLQTFMRPRFFAGQLLTDSELTALTTYVVDKQRFHNVHLHGWGVVCGLQVECDGCGPGVLVRPGYAIDPCGSDIVVPNVASVDVISLINACTAAERAPECDPPRYPQAVGCDDEQTWCLTVRYREQDSRPVAPLGGTATSTCGCSGGTSGGCGCSGGGGRSSGGCGCGGNGSGGGTKSSGGCGCGGSARPGWECTCSNGSSRSTTTCGCSPAPRPSNRPADCEPSRTYEMYEFGVYRSDGSCHDLGARLDGSFPAKVLECIKEIQPVVSRKMTPSMQKSAGSLLLGGSVGIAADDARTAVCTLYDNILDLYRKDPLRTQCVLPAEFSQIDCTPQQEGETDSHYQNRLVESLQTLVTLVLLYLRDCVCYHLMPPCPEAPCDDRVVLACMTVKDGRVVSICNHDCRRYAGSFVTREYWLPIGPVLSWLAGLFCCFPLLDLTPRLRGRDRAQLGLFTAGVKYERIRRTLRSNDFAAVSLWRARAGQIVQRLRPSVLAERLDTTLEKQDDRVPLAPYQGVPVERAVVALRRQNITVERIEVAERWQAPITGLFPTVAPGGTATLYVHDEEVVGFGDPTPGPEPAPREAAPPEPAPREAAPRKAAPRKAAPGKAAPRKAAPRKAPGRTPPTGGG